MQNLGKIFFIIMLFCTAMYAEVDVSVDKAQVTRGERVTYTLTVTGTQAVDIPPIDSLCGYDIEGRMQSQRTVISNGSRVQELSLEYVFMPQRSCTIEPLKVTIDGKEEKTQAIDITVSKMSISKNEPFEVHLKTDKTSVYVGEPFEMRVNFKQRRGVGVYDQSIALPESKNIWIKSQHEGRPAVENMYELHENMYALSAQQSGKLTLGPLRWNLQVKAKSRDSWGMLFSQLKTHTVFSNELDIEVKPLPEGIEIVGDVKMKAELDKSEVHAGEAVNVTISIQGRANVEDIPAFDLYIDGAQAFKEEPKVMHYLKDGRYYGAFTQKFAIVAERDFTLKAFTLSYMDVDSDTVKRLSTEPLHVKVINPVQNVDTELKVIKGEPKVNEKAETSSEMSALYAVMIFISGLLIGVLLMLIPWRLLKRENSNKKTLKADVSKATLQALIPHMHESDDCEELVKKMSENLYEGTSHKIDKKVLKEILKSIN